MKRHIESVRQPITNSDLVNDRPWFIAGGYAACPSMARDCDVWVLVSNGDGREVCESILRTLRRANVDFTEEENDPEVDQEFYDLGDGVLNWRVAKINDTPQPRHILVTSALNIQQLLDNFDISTHQCALSSDGEFIRGAQWTPLSATPRAFRMGTTTPERLKKIERRYAAFRNGVRRD